MIEGRPDPLPEHAIWVGWQPVLKELFPGTNFEFSHPEEILIAANANHLVIAGRDRWDPERLTVMGDDRKIEGKQLEYGTANAVYTFLQDQLGVRWLWPGELGEDVKPTRTIAFAALRVSASSADSLAGRRVQIFVAREQGLRSRRTTGPVSNACNWIRCR